MSINCKLLWCSLFCLLLVTGARAQDESAGDEGSHTEAQTVRVSLLEGDVRVMRGKKAEKATGNTWEQAQLNLPIEAGFSLVTGSGRAEIEFEDASTAYLGEDSVLTFGKLTSKSGETHTELQLIDGTLTLNFIPAKGDWLSISSPTDTFIATGPDKMLLRFNSFTDALGVTPFRHPFTQHIGTSSTWLPVGLMAIYRQGMLIPARNAHMNNAAFARWDAWVDHRVTLREETLAQTMGQSGLDAPVAGLADLEGQGDFFDCAPYGRCWQPDAGWQQGPADDQTASPAATDSHAIAQSGTQNANAQTISVAALQSGGSTQASTKRTGAVASPYVEEDYFPCGPRDLAYQFRLGYLQPYPWEWVVCHSGSWIRRGNRYAWVVERRRHHHPPVRWVKVDGKKAFVPLHPRDEKDKPPVNAKYGLFAVKEHEATRPEHLAFNPSASMKLLDDAPKSFRQDSFEPLRAAAAPRIEAHLMRDATVFAFAHPPASALAHAPSASLITFDHKSQSFVATRQSMEGGHNVEVKQSLGGGPAAAHSGGWSGGGGAGGGTAHNSGGGGFSGGGSSSHAGGGGGGFSGGGGGGASHGGGSSSSSGGASAGGASSSGGGSSAGGGGGGHPGH